MGMGGWGALAGLGQGLSQGANLFMQGRQLDNEAKHRALQLALQQEQLALRGQELGQEAAEKERAAMQWIVANTPADTLLSPESRTARERLGFGDFVRPEFGLDPSRVLAEGLPLQSIGDTLAGRGFQAGQASVGDTGRGLSVPTDDARSRAAAFSRQASMERAMLRAQTQAQIAAGRQALQQAELELKQKLATGQLAVNDARVQAMLAGIQQGWARIAQVEEQMSADEAWRYNVVAPDMAIDNEINSIRALRPPSAGGGQGINIMQFMPGAQQPGQAAPAAPAAQNPRKLGPNGQVLELDPKTGQWKPLGPGR